MSRKILSMQSAILQIADLSKLTVRLEHQKLSDPDPDAVDQRPLYQVAVYLEES
jgi:hypothetical protein